MGVLDRSLDDWLNLDLPGEGFRKRQIYHWLHEKLVLDYAAMTNLPKKLVAYLEEQEPLPNVRVVQKLTSKDGTVKLLFALGDDFAEAVVMEYHYGSSVCLSTQIGCRMGCKFCASTLNGWSRNITASEMLMMLYLANRYSTQRISRIVLMGSGEPLENLDEVLRFLHQAMKPDGYNLSGRHISLSTCGIPEGILRLAEEKLPITLALSLHAPNDDLRRQIMPIANRYPIREIMTACDTYIERTSRRVTIEYAMIAGFNDSAAQADELAELIRGKLYHVNLIPVNPIAERDYQAPERDSLTNFQKRLEAHRIHVTIRRELGSDIVASCGQLRNQAIEQNNKAGG